LSPSRGCGLVARLWSCREDVVDLSQGCGIVAVDLWLCTSDVVN
jgi:hypothetical protein